MFEAFVIVVDYREDVPDYHCVVAFVASTWEIAEDFIKTNKDYDAGDDWHWGAQVMYIDNSDTFNSLGELREYTKTGELIANDV